MKNLRSFCLGVLFMTAHVQAQTVNARLDVNQGLANGSITATHTEFDLGTTLTEVFDNNASTLSRTPSINPMVITLSFSAPITLTANKIILTTEGNWTVETAANFSDLNSGTGTYRKVINQRPLTGGVVDSVGFTPVSAVYVRLTALRTGGDDYVHLNEWQLYAQQTLSSISIKKTPFFIFKTTGAEINPLQKTSLKLQGATASGVNVDILSGITWSSSNTSIATVSSAGVLSGLANGTANITATFLGISTTLQVKVASDRNGSDLSVQYIKRVPEIAYVENSTNPAVEGWPAANSTVTWRAYVKNWFPVARNNVSYRWLWNGAQIATGTVNIPARGVARVDLPRTWTFARNELTFEIDANNTIAELTEANNQLKIYTNAISLNLTVEQSLYEYFHRYQSTVGTGNTAIEKMNSFDDWAQNRHVKRWNQMFANAIYPETPNGVLDRIRIDSIILVPDNAIPLVAGPVNYPNINDLTVDLQWGFPFRLTNNDNFYADTLGTTDENPFFFEGSFLHELGHARYLIDEYGYDVNDIDGSVIAIKENGEFIGGTSYLPEFFDDIVYLGQQTGLMNTQHNTHVDRHSAAALNLIAGHRAVAGNGNPPGNMGIFMNDLPAENRFTLKNASGAVLVNASVKVYQTASLDGGVHKHFDDIPELTLTSDASGRVLVGENPFQVDGHINLAPEGIILLRVETATQVGYEFFESSWFNLAYWGGHTTLADYDLVFDNLVTKTITTGINGPSCVTSGQANTFILSPEFNNFNNISWWVNGDATIVRDPSDPKKVTITVSAYNSSYVTVNAGVNYPTAPWYQAYQKQVFVNNCNTSRTETSDLGQSSNNLVDVTVFDFGGKVLLKGNTYDVESFMRDQPLPSGLYLMKITDNASTYVVKVAK